MAKMERTLKQTQFRFLPEENTLRRPVICHRRLVVLFPHFSHVGLMGQMQCFLICTDADEP